MRIISWLASKALGPDKAPLRVLPEVPLTAPVSAAVSCPQDFPAAPPGRIAAAAGVQPPSSTPPLPFGVATYADSQPGAVVWFPDPGPARDPIGPGTGRG